MAKNEAGNKPGSDRPYYESKSGIVFSPAVMANDITGTPPMPGYRGGPDNPGTGTLGKEGKNRNNGVVSKFFSKGE